MRKLIIAAIAIVILLSCILTCNLSVTVSILVTESQTDSVGLVCDESGNCYNPQNCEIGQSGSIMCWNK